MTSLQHIDETLKRMKNAVRDGSKSGAVVPLFETLFESQSDQYTYRHLAEFLAYLAATPKGTMDGCYGEWEELVYQDNLDCRIPSPSTVMQHLYKFEEEPLPPNLSFNDRAMWHAVDGILRLVFQCSQDLFDLGDGQFYVSLDITPMRFFGEIIEEFRDGKWYVVEVKSPSAKTATAQYTTTDGQTKQTFEDTRWGHSYLVMCAHHWKTKISFPLAIRYVGDFNRDTEGLITDMLNVLRKYPRPSWIMADRGFCNTAVTNLLKAFCDEKPGATHFLIPMKHQREREDDEEPLDSQRRTPRQLGREKSDGSTKIDDQPDVAFAPADWSWSKTPKITHQLVFFYRQKREAGQATEYDIDAADMNLDKDLITTMFITNKVVTKDNAALVYGLYGGRWAIEILFKRHKRNAARCPAQTEYMRFLSFALSQVVYGCYGLWRWNRCQRMELSFDDRQIREARYLLGLRTEVAPKAVEVAA